MEQRLIGRKAELKLLNEYINSDKSEFIAVYGRRRVGKTFLIRKAVEDHFAFFMTGMNGVAKGEQLVNFSIALQKYTHSTTLQTFKSWLLKSQTNLSAQADMAEEPESLCPFVG